MNTLSQSYNGVPDIILDIDCLDEVLAIVLDLGSHSVKAGYVGEDQPKSVFPSVSLVLRFHNSGAFHQSIV